SNLISKYRLIVLPAAVNRTWYFPGVAMGPRTLPPHNIMPLKELASGYRRFHSNLFNPNFTLGGFGFLASSS
ncbi:hypothetical protein ACMWQA_27680, partial [Escherichia coli]|uniref:hypothetical protein n=1 Tax=Escherichia coli TaxID=562 RepID=UPI0039E12A10